MPFDHEAVKEILSFAERAVAAGVGAWAAFRLQAAREGRKRRTEQAQALRDALSVLAAQRNGLLAIDRHIAPLRQDGERHLLLHPALASGSSQALDFSRLAFLTSIKDSDLLSRLDVTEVQFRSVVDVLTERNAMHFRFQERVAAASEASLARVDSDALSRVVGRVVVLQLKEMTDALYRGVEDALESNQVCLCAVQDAMRTVFPRERVPRVIQDEERA